MDLTEALDHYCERLGPDFWAEPVNALSNLAFILAALAGFLLWRRLPRRDWPILGLILVVLATGIGSFLFHTFATRWAMLADVIPIAIFIHAYLLVALIRILGLRWWLALVATVLFLLASPYIGGAVQGVAGSSSGYVPALIALFVVGLAALPRRRTAGISLCAVGGLFAVSVTLRTLDAPLCTSVPLGTHFLWHILNGAVLFSLLWVLISLRQGYTRE